ncbi:hypothetical protein HY734_01525 [Candidatus Uhrbacteria bacterium]|nr:hypothetical protein [Candidatus Uhrbacteria bacterium]
MKKCPYRVHVFTFAALLLLAGAGCTSEIQTTPSPSPSDEAAVETTAFARYEDAVLGIAFEYPEAWGAITAQNEVGFEFEDNGSVKTAPGGIPIQKGIVHRTLIFSGLRAEPSGREFFLVGSNPSGGGILGRGGYFGDLSDGFQTREGVEEWCQEQQTCETFSTPNGIRVAHIYHPSIEEWGEVTEDVDYYAIHHPDHAFSGLVISNEDVIDAGLGRQEEAMRHLVDSLEFLPPSQSRD